MLPHLRRLRFVQRRVGLVITAIIPVFLVIVVVASGRPGRLYWIACGVALIAAFVIRVILNRVTLRWRQGIEQLNFEVCPSCGYELGGAMRCPECGSVFTAGQPRATWVASGLFGQMKSEA